jgi:AcrR family transcriptional regulator
MIDVIVESEIRDQVTASTGRERILEAAYELFGRSGVRAVGIDAIISQADVAKMTLYRNFASKSELAMACMQLREDRWTIGWLQAEVLARAETPGGRLLAIFEVFSEWFAREGFEGCPFLTALLEFEDRDDPVRAACLRHLANIRAFVAGLAEEAGIEDPVRFAAQWHILMTGSIVAAHEGRREAAREAQELAELLLERHGVAVALDP